MSGMRLMIIINYYLITSCFLTATPDFRISLLSPGHQFDFIKRKRQKPFLFYILLRDNPWNKDGWTVLLRSMSYHLGLLSATLRYSHGLVECLYHAPLFTSMIPCECMDDDTSEEAMAQGLAMIK